MYGRVKRVDIERAEQKAPQGELKAAMLPGTLELGASQGRDW